VKALQEELDEIRGARDAALKDLEKTRLKVCI